MELVLLQDFGFRKKGDIVEVPDGAEFAAGYYAKVSENEPEIPASSSPVSEGLADAPKEHDDTDEPDEATEEKG
jgi:hypothetical protein